MKKKKNNIAKAYQEYQNCCSKNSDIALRLSELESSKHTMPNKKYLEEKAKAEAELDLSSTNRYQHMLAHSEILRNGPNPNS